MLGSGQLDRRQRVPARGLLELRDGRCRERRADALLDDQAQGRAVEQAPSQLERERFRQLPDERGDGLVGLARPDGGQDPDALGKPADREGEHGGRRLVEPLNVVDRDDAGRQLAEQGDEAGADGPQLERPRCGLEQERRRQGVPRHLRHPRQQADGGSHEVVERGVGARRLGRGRARDEHRRPVGARSFDHRRPERRLADSRLALDQSEDRVAAGAEEGAEGLQLGLTADDHDGTSRA